MMICFIVDAIFNNKPDLTMFRYKNTNDKFMSNEELHNIKMQGLKVSLDHLI